eukprot:CAMPEP_0183464056 /NCGR_PEP_ID=MMETSP0370-20130417/144704_1 /TAXON_ID=268820 /ORGANISM="Peridinium aciculiferum, Strain PAER-2" /LENGTH=52 /DNA_ID=CAMNT_0025656193 /DNA_START=34 /DNA_END=189 /DNA_ORIENTATION=-
MSPLALTIVVVFVVVNVVEVAGKRKRANHMSVQWPLQSTLHMEPFGGALPSV